MGKTEINRIMEIVPNIMNLAYDKIWTFYDKEADVLYIDFKKPGHADDSEISDDNIIVRYEKDEVIGLTVLNASKRRKSS